ncbi:MAG: hypoxanthine phosphoribosyltransferase [Lachnospiraceae bacterium]|nr:hypoxanthine phosphoribosyltransferase [Lachnospiraceae bacterium]
MNENIDVLFSQEVLENRIKEIADKINEEYKGKKLHMVCVLRGAVFFFTELCKHINVPVTMDFLVCSSYGSGTTTSGEVKIVKDLADPIAGLDVILVEDIVDTGVTLNALKPMLMTRKPASLKIATMLDKPSRRRVVLEPDYCAFEVDDLFVIGYGLDYDQKYRNLPFIGVYKGE